MNLSDIDNFLFFITAALLAIYTVQFHKLMKTLKHQLPDFYQSIGSPTVWSTPRRLTPRGKYTPYAIFRKIPASFPDNKEALMQAKRNLYLGRMALAFIAVYILFTVWRSIAHPESYL